MKRLRFRGALVLSLILILFRQYWASLLPIAYFFLQYIAIIMYLYINEDGEIVEYPKEAEKEKIVEEVNYPGAKIRVDPKYVEFLELVGNK